MALTEILTQLHSLQTQVCDALVVLFNLDYMAHDLLCLLIQRTLSTHVYFCQNQVSKGTTITDTNLHQTQIHYRWLMIGSRLQRTSADVSHTNTMWHTDKDRRMCRNISSKKRTNQPIKLRLNNRRESQTGENKRLQGWEVGPIKIV